MTLYRRSYKRRSQLSHDGDRTRGYPRRGRNRDHYAGIIATANAAGGELALRYFRCGWDHSI